jgi:hypothetical protein
MKQDTALAQPKRNVSKNEPTFSLLCWANLCALVNRDCLWHCALRDGTECPPAAIAYGSSFGASQLAMLVLKKRFLWLWVLHQKQQRYTQLHVHSALALSIHLLQLSVIKYPQYQFFGHCSLFTVHCFNLLIPISDIPQRCPNVYCCMTHQLKR